MKYETTTHWDDPQASRGLVYFAQRFDELTWAYTLDSYRAPTTNPPSLIGECISNLKLNRQLNRPPKAVKYIVTEARLRLKANPIATRCMTLPVDRYFEFKVEEIDASIDRLTLLARELSQQTYLSACMSHLIEVVPTHRKSEIDFAVRELASTLLNIGFSAKHLSEVCKSHFFSTNNVVSGSESLLEFLAELRPQMAKYSVYFDADSKIKELNPEFREGFSVNEINAYPKKVKSAAIKQSCALPNKSYKIVVFNKIEALDKYGALSKAQARLNWIHDIYGLFRHRNSLAIATDAVVVTNDEVIISVVRTDGNHMHRISDNRKQQANTKLAEMLVDLRLPRHSDKNRFFRVINFHGLAARTSSAENQLINLWTALETITSSHSSGASIVDTVVRETIPIICLNYAQRLFKSLKSDLWRWDKKRLIETLKKCPDSDKRDLTESVFNLIIAVENDEIKEDFLGSIDDFELMRYRLFALNKAFKTGAKIKEKIERHEQLVSWQIHRIYRARNQIVHSSHPGSNLDSLIVNAHDYFDQVFDVTANLCSGQNGFNTYDESFNYCLLRYTEYKKQLSKIDRVAIGNAETVLWKPKPKS